jgi:hypothetical protein
MRTFTRPCRVTLIMVCALTFCVYAQAVNLKVNCNSTGTLSAINGALKLLNPQGPNTLTVSGNCKENVVIQSFDRLTLIANPGALINDASGGTVDVITIVDSQRITIQGFTINGGGEGIICYSHSLCRFNGNTIQGSTGDGVSISRARAEFMSNIIQNHPGRGLDVREAGEALTDGDTIRSNGAAGVRLEDGSFLFAVSSTVQGNGGNGIRLTDHSTLRSRDNTITANGANGVSLEGGSEARFGVDVTGNVVTGNAGHGVSVNDLSFANFESPGNSVSGNTTQPDVVCNPQFSGERGALPTSNIGGGTTNCTEP